MASRFFLPHKFLKDMATRVNFKAIEDFLNETIVVNIVEKSKDVVADPDNLPDIPLVKLPTYDGYFSSADPTGAPLAPTGLGAMMAFNTLNLKWSLPSEAAFRKWRIYESTTSGTVFDQQTSTLMLETDQHVTSITKVPSSTVYYYWVVAVNTRGETSEAVSFSDTGFVFRQVITSDIASADLAAIKSSAVSTAMGLVSSGLEQGTLKVYKSALAQGAVDLGSTVCVGNLAADKIVAGTIGAAVIWGGTIATDKLVAGTAKINEALIGDLSAGKITSGTLSAQLFSTTEAWISKAQVGTLDASKITVTNLDAAQIKTGTLSANFISGGTLSGVTVNSVSSGGAVVQLANGEIKTYFTATPAYIGGIRTDDNGSTCSLILEPTPVPNRTLEVVAANRLRSGVVYATDRVESEYYLWAKGHGVGGGLRIENENGTIYALYAGTDGKLYMGTGGTYAPVGQQ